MIKYLSVFALVAAMTASLVGTASAASTCAEQLQRVKAAVNDVGSNQKVEKGKAIAVVKIREAEEALAKKDEASCINAVQAADASMK
jgi:hypothetical protein